MVLKRTEEEIDDVLNRAAEAEDAGKTQWPGMTYEQGVAAALHWAVGNQDNNPMDDD